MMVMRFKMTKFQIIEVVESLSQKEQTIKKSKLLVWEMKSKIEDTTMAFFPEIEQS